LHVSEFRYIVLSRSGVVVAFVSAPRQRKGMTMELLVLAIVVLVAFGAYRFMRARATH
jgi:hypothetical protein